MTESKDFIIKDKRFSAQEEQDSKTKDKDKDPSKKDTKEKEGKDAAAAEQQDAEPQLPEINFATFILSLNSAALLHLGIIDDPATGKKVTNLALGKQTIDILGMLEEKTRGNITNDEGNMLKNILYDLRMLYIQKKG